MRSPRTALLVFALMAIVLTAWAGNGTVASKPRSNRDDKTAVVQSESDKKDEQSDEATQSNPGEDRAPRSRERDIRTPEDRSEAPQAPRSEPNRVQTPEPRPEVIRAPRSVEQGDRDYVAPARVQPSYGGRRSIDAGEINVPQPSGEPRRQRGSNYGGYQGGYRSDPFDRRPGHFYGGGGWHGRHDQWRHNRFRGSWRFLFHFGPVLYFAPIHYPHIIRIPHDRVGVYVRYTGEDAVGAAFANSVREHLRDEGLLVAYSQDDARLELYIISMEQDPDDAGYGSAISVSYIWYPGHKFITAQMVDAGLDEVDDLAASVAGYADELVDDYR